MSPEDNGAWEFYENYVKPIQEEMEDEIPENWESEDPYPFSGGICSTCLYNDDLDSGKCSGYKMPMKMVNKNGTKKKCRKFREFGSNTKKIVCAKCGTKQGMFVFGGSKLFCADCDQAREKAGLNDLPIEIEDQGDGKFVIHPKSGGNALFSNVSKKHDKL